jgi:single-stranded DNA-binding protein
VTSFSLCVVESWVDETGKQKRRNNVVLIEVLGRDAETVASTARLGSWVTLEGYVRSEEARGQHVVKVRTLRIEVWEQPDAQESQLAGGSQEAPREAPL